MNIFENKLKVPNGICVVSMGLKSFFCDEDGCNSQPYPMCRCTRVIPAHVGMRQRDHNEASS